MIDGYMFDEHGNIIESKVYIMYGSPASGKSTYVKEHKKVNDFIIDLDLIKQGLGANSKTNDAEQFTELSLKVREYIYTLIENNSINGNDIWVVASLPTYEEREALRIRLDATLVFIDATEEQCIQRAMLDNDRHNKELQVKIIRKWFKRYFYE